MKNCRKKPLPGLRHSGRAYKKAAASNNLVLISRSMFRSACEVSTGFGLFKQYFAQGQMRQLAVVFLNPGTVNGARLPMPGRRALL